MPVIFTTIISLLSSLGGPFKEWSKFKQEELTVEREVQLATLKAQAQQMMVEAASDADELKYRLSSTTRQFKQTTFWLLYIPVVLSICLPKHAAVMWGNFSLIPQWFQWLFLAVYSSIWGIPIVKNGYGAFTDLLQSKQDHEYRVEQVKANINETKVFDSLRQSIFTHGLTQQQVTAVEAALKAGQDGP